jgi:hypothetical protein
MLQGSSRDWWRQSHVAWGGELDKQMLPSTISRQVVSSRRGAREVVISSLIQRTMQAICLHPLSARSSIKRVSWVRKRYSRIDRSNFEKTDDAGLSYATEAVLATMYVAIVDQ